MKEEHKNPIIQILDESGEQINWAFSHSGWRMYDVNESGKYEFTIKVNTKIFKKFTVNIDRYEIISTWNGLVVYDFQQGEILPIDSGEYGEYKNTETILENIPNADIMTEKDKGSFIITEIPVEKTYKFKLKSKENTILGFNLRYYTDA